jgi:integrase
MHTAHQTSPGERKKRRKAADLKRLTWRQIQALPVGSHWVDDLLYAIVSKTPKTITWKIRFSRPNGGGPNEMRVGRADVVSLEQARDKAVDVGRMVRQGVDPMEARRTARKAREDEAIAGISFSEVAGDYLADLEAGGKFRNPRTIKGVRLLLLGHAKALAKMPVGDVGASHIACALRPLWLEHPDQERRARAAIIAVLRYAKARQLRGPIGDLAMELKDLRPVNGRKAPRHHASMDYRQIPGFMQRLREWKADAMSSSVIRFLILTACRAGEVSGMRWDEISWEEKLWTIPPERMKSNRVHRVPLSDSALALLQRQRELTPRGCAFVWPGRSGKKPIRAHAFYLFLRESMKVEEATIHGMRASFSSWCGNETHFDRVTSELALGHAAGSAVELAYRRGDELAKRRELMTAWADYCESGCITTSVPTAA